MTQRATERFPVGRPRGARRRPAVTVSAATTATPRRTRTATDVSHATTATAAVGARLTSKQRLVSTLYNLEMDVTALRQHIQQLTLHRSLLHTRALYSPVGVAVKKAQGYFHAFRHGFRDRNVAAAAYLVSIADDDLQLGVTGLGRNVLLEQWRRYTAYFAIRKYEITNVRVLAREPQSNACVVRGEGVFHGTFTRQALEIAFPMVLQDPWLTQELLGRALVTPVAFVLHFDEHGRFVRHDGEVDFWGALAQTLGDPGRAAAIMERAQVAEEGMLDAPDHEHVPVETVARVARVKRSRVAAYKDEEDEERRGGYNGHRGTHFPREPDFEPDEHADGGEHEEGVFFVAL